MIRNLSFIFILLTSIHFIACEKEPDGADSQEDPAYGRLRMELTDAPFDDLSIQAVYVTLVEVRVDGESLLELSRRKTIDISNYQHGRAIQVGTDQILRVGIYTDLELVFDLELDESGRGIGCYVLDQLGEKHSLSFGESKIKVSVPGSFEIKPETVTRLVVDMDLRKAIVRSSTGKYTFENKARLTSSLRQIDVALAGGIEGKVDAGSTGQSSYAKRVIYAFPQNTLVVSTAAATDFDAAISSVAVRTDGSFKLNYLPAGQYDLIAVDYDDADQSGRVRLLGIRQSDAAVGLDVRKVWVSAGAQTRVAITLGQILP